MAQNAETPRAESGALPEDSAAGEADAIVAQVRRRREAAERCEPFDCGHRDPVDCTAADCGEGMRSAHTPDPESDRVDREPDVDPDALTELWANAKTAWTARDFPKYGSREWIELGPDDPRRLAGALEAAEMWRRYGDEDALLAWFRDAFRSRPSLAERRTRAELDAAAKPKPPHQLQATPGWPPIRVPGRPGRYLTYTEGRAAA